MKRILFLLVLLCFLGICGIVKGQVPVITGQPSGTVVCAGSDATLTVNASNNPISYTWQTNYNGYTWTTLTDDAAHSGTNTANLTIHTGALSTNEYIYRCIANNADGSSDPSNEVYVTTYPHAPNAPSRFALQKTSICTGTNDVYFAVGSVGWATDYTWTYSGSNVIIVHKSGDTAVKVNFGTTATSGTLGIAAVNVCGTSPFITVPVTVNSLQSTPAASPGNGPICTSYTVATDGTTYSDPATCSPISAISPSGVNPVTGIIQSCVTVDASVQSYGGIPYVQRHYNLEPVTNPTTSTATVTLYFTQSDFDAYNLARGTNPALPATSTDAAGIANLRVTQFHGTGTDPGTYVGGSGDIDPDDNNIVWNAGASRWEVTFNITGFSGFFVSGGSLAPLPLTLVSFTGQAVTGGNLLSWITSSEENTRDFEVQRDGGNGFQPLAVIPAAGNSHSNLNYSYTDPLSNNAGATNTYRLKMADLDGKFTYSKVVVLQSPLSALSIRILPNPFHQPLSLTVSSPQTANGVITVTDLSGKLLIKQNASLQKGENNLDAGKIANLPKGMYFLSITTAGQKQTVKFVKE